jgi:BirA family biotin operon repressor/biotin-[acetyl-CoA-carboxylase] ligase
VKLGPEAQARGYRLEHYGSLGSTSDACMERARAGDQGQLWIVADAQTKGRGRMARPWSSPPGNLYASLLLIDPAPPSVAPQLGFVAGIALADAVASVLPAQVSARLKWPNDLLIDGAKLSGLLIDATQLPGNLFACVIGFGVNCAASPGDTPYPATSLAAHGAQSGPEAVFGALSDAMPRWLDTWARGQNFMTIRREWLARALPPGSPLRVKSGETITDGTFVSLDMQGRLMLDCSGTTKLFDAGDVFPAQPAPQENAGSGGIF